MLRVRSLAIRKASVLVRAFVADTGTEGSKREQHHALDNKRRQCHRAHGGEPSTFHARALRYLHSDAAANQGQRAEDLQEDTSVTFVATDADEKAEPLAKLERQVGTVQEEEHEDAQEQPHTSPAEQEHEADSAAGLVKGIERVTYATNSASNNPDAIQEALGLLEAGRAVGVNNLAVYNAIFRFLCMSTKASGTIAEVLEQMKRDGITPDLETYNLIIFGYANGKEVASAQRTYGELEASGLEPNDITLSNMIVAHSWGNVKDMMRIFYVLQSKEFKPTKTAYHSMMSGLRREEKWESIRKVINALVEDGLIPTEAGFAFGFMSARRLCDPQLATMLLERRNQAGLTPRQDFFVNVMVTLGEAGKSDEVLDVWRQLVCLQGIEGVTIRPETFFLAMRHAVKVKAWDEVEAIIGMIQDDGRPIDEKVHNVLLGRRQDITAVKDVERLLVVLENMEIQSGIELKPISQLHLAVLCADVKMHDRAMPLFDAARSAGVTLGKFHRPALLSTLVAVGKLPEAKAEWTKATWAHKRDFTGSTLQLFMRVAERLGDADMALELHHESFKAQKRYARWFHPIALQVLAEAGRLEEAFGIAETLRSRGQPKLPPRSYDILCQCCKERGDKESIVKVVETMRKGNLSMYLPPPNVLGFVVEAFIERGKAKELISLFDRMRAQRLQPDPEVYALLAGAAVDANDHEKAGIFLEMARKGGLEPSPRAVAFAEGDAPRQAEGAA